MSDREWFGLRTGRAHEGSGGELTLEHLHRKCGFLFGFEFNKPIMCSLGVDSEGREPPKRRIVPDLRQSQARLVVEVDGQRHVSDPEVAANDAERDALLAQNGWKVMRIASSEIFPVAPSQVIRVVREIESEAMMRIMEIDQRKGVPPDSWRVLPIGPLSPCALCGTWRSSHAVGDGFVCVQCIYERFRRNEYWPPLFECTYCQRKMERPQDVIDWPCVDGEPTLFVCPGECLSRYDDEDSSDFES